jgi:hypothetical protein
MQKQSFGTVVWAFSAHVLTLSLLHSAEPSPSPYDTGFAQIERLSRSLHELLDANWRASVASTPVSLDPSKTPFLGPMRQPGGPPFAGHLAVSAGLVDLLNYLAHAKALDAVHRGLLPGYLTRLAQAPDDGPLPNLSYCRHKKTWAARTLNEQASAFNQMSGGLVAMQMAHHYLGHYQKYAAQLAGAPGGPSPSLNRLLSAAEWQEAVMAGARHALDGALSVEGLISFFEAMEKLPKRPKWAEALVPPPSISITALSRDLRQLERQFFDH